MVFTTRHMSLSHSFYIYAAYVASACMHVFTPDSCIISFILFLWIREWRSIWKRWSRYGLQKYLWTFFTLLIFSSIYRLVMPVCPPSLSPIEDIDHVLWEHTLASIMTNFIVSGFCNFSQNMSTWTTNERHT